jgi:mannosyltransferase OCH1-like enzyme
MTRNNSSSRSIISGSRRDKSANKPNNTNTNKPPKTNSKANYSKRMIIAILGIIVLTMSQLVLQIKQSHKWTRQLEPWGVDDTRLQEWSTNWMSADNNNANDSANENERPTIPPPPNIMKVFEHGPESSPKECGEGLVRIEDYIDPSLTQNRHKVTKIVHQTGKSRCVVPMFASLMQSWHTGNMAGYSYRFHDDGAVEDFLFHRPGGWPEFPLVQELLKQCVTSPTMKADIWRYLILWEYGGIYADMDSAVAPGPPGFTNNTIQPEDDAVSLIEALKVPAQYWLSASPRHPFMFYSAMSALSNVQKTMKHVVFDAATSTGPKAVTMGIHYFMESSDSPERDFAIPPVGRNLQPGLYLMGDPFQGGLTIPSASTQSHSQRRSVRVVGSRGHAELVARDAVSRQKKNMYHKMNMTHYHEHQRGNRKKGNKGHSCMLQRYMNVSVNVNYNNNDSSNQGTGEEKEKNAAPLLTIHQVVIGQVSPITEDHDDGNAALLLMLRQVVSENPPDKVNLKLQIHDEVSVRQLLQTPHIQETFPLLRDVLSVCDDAVWRSKSGSTSNTVNGNDNSNSYLLSSSPVIRWILLWEYGGVYMDRSLLSDHVSSSNDAESEAATNANRDQLAHFLSSFLAPLMFDDGGEGGEDQVQVEGVLFRREPKSPKLSPDLMAFRHHHPLVYFVIQYYTTLLWSSDNLEQQSKVNAAFYYDKGWLGFDWNLVDESIEQALLRFTERPSPSSSPPMQRTRQRQLRSTRAENENENANASNNNRTVTTGAAGEREADNTNTDTGTDNYVNFSQVRSDSDSSRRRPSSSQSRPRPRRKLPTEQFDNAFRSLITTRVPDMEQEQHGVDLEAEIMTVAHQSNAEAHTPEPLPTIDGYHGGSIAIVPPMSSSRSSWNNGMNGGLLFKMRNKPNSQAQAEEQQDSLIYRNVTKSDRLSFSCFQALYRLQLQ